MSTKTCEKRIREMAVSLPYLSAHPHGVILRIHVQPRASKNELAGIHQGSLKVRLTAPPVEGEANRECIKFIAKLLGVPKSSVELVQGQKSRHKTLLIRGISSEKVQSIIAEHSPREVS
jgi:uncharacterized protein